MKHTPLPLIAMQDDCVLTRFLKMRTGLALTIQGRPNMQLGIITELMRASDDSLLYLSSLAVEDENQRGRVEKGSVDSAHNGTPHRRGSGLPRWGWDDIDPVWPKVTI